MTQFVELTWESGLDNIAYDNSISFEEVQFRDILAFSKMHHSIFKTSKWYVFLQRIYLPVSGTLNYFILNAAKERVGIVSFLPTYKHEIRLLNFGILEPFRGSGYAYESLSRVLQYCSKNRLWCTLICRSSNTVALNMYRKLNFKQLEDC